MQPLGYALPNATYRGGIERGREGYFKVLPRNQFQREFKKSEPERTMGRVNMVERKISIARQTVQHRSLIPQYTRSICHKCGIAQSAYVAQGFGPVTFTTGTDGAMGTVEKKRIDSLHGNLGHMTTVTYRRPWARNRFSVPIIEVVVVL